jgi:hypothetical protein
MGRSKQEMPVYRKLFDDLEISDLVTPLSSRSDPPAVAVLVDSLIFAFLGQTPALVYILSRKAIAGGIWGKTPTRLCDSLPRIGQDSHIRHEFHLRNKIC